jgi:murein DD-endopeptidase MepM/ murein hydrolase activator NlpD
VRRLHRAQGARAFGVRLRGDAVAAVPLSTRTVTMHTFPALRFADIEGVGTQSRTGRVARFASHLIVVAGLGVTLPAALEAAPVSISDGAELRTLDVSVRKGDTVHRILDREGIDPENRDVLLRALADRFDERRLKVGDRIQLTLERGPADTLVRALRVETGHAGKLTIRLGDDRGATFAAGERTDVVIRHASGVVGQSFAKSLRAAKVPAALIGGVVAAFQLDPDLPRVLPRDAHFSVVYEGTPKRRSLDDVRIRCASIDHGGKIHRIYRYETRDGELALVHDDGTGVALLALRKPVVGAPVTSPYGWRVHPVLGDRRFHKGIDLGAPIGTPVVAAAEGVVEDAGWRGNYGRYLRIRHDRHLETSYAHLSRFAPGLRVGARVTRGQRIGFVGETGIATGPHLYFEVIFDDVRVDPLAVPAAVPIQLNGTELAKFRMRVQDLSGE